MTLNIKDMVKGGQKVKFVCYGSGELWYVTDSGFEFPVPIDDTGDGIFLATDKAMLFMRYIRKHIEYLEESKQLQLKEQDKFAKESQFHLDTKTV
jgi:hypothetical protein